MARVLLVDTNFSSGPIYRELVSMGHDVHVVGTNPNDYLAKISSNYWNLNYADTDALAALVNKNKFEFLVPGCTDRSYTSCVAVSAGGFPGLDTVEASEAIFNKGKFRLLADRLNLPVPKKLASNLSPSRWPIIVKPADAFSGKGITVLQEKDLPALAEAISLARDVSPTGDYLIEEFVEGQLHSHSAFLRNQKVIQDFIVQEDSTVNPFVVDTSRVVHDAPPSLLARLRECIEVMARKLSLTDGLIHTQFIRNGEDFWLIEITRRCPGDLYSHSIMRHTITLAASQSFAFLRFKLPLQIEQWTPLSLAGDQLKPSPQSRVGILFCRADDQKNLDHLYQQALRRDLYEVHS